MSFSKLNAGDKRILIVAAVVIVTAITSIADRWGFGAILGLLGGAAAAAVVLQPQLAPTVKLPVTRGLALLAAGGVAAIGFVLAALRWVSYLFDFSSIFNPLFDVGLVASIVLAWFGWVAYQAEPKATAPAAAAPAAPAAAASTAPPAPPPATPEA